MSDLKAKFRDGLIHFCSSNYQIDFGKLSDVQRGEGLVLFYISNILAKKMPGVFPEEIEEIREFITDGAHDQSCDFIFSQDDHHYIIQSKYKKRNSLEEEGEVIKFLNVLERLHFEYGKDNKKNRKVEDAISAFDYKNHTFSLYYITLGKGNNDTRILEQNGLKNVSDCKDLADISNRSDFQFLDESDLNMQYRDVQNGVELKNVDLQISKDEDGNFWYKHSNNQGLKSYITSITSSQVYEIYQRHRSSLFNLNIRQHLGDNSTNKGIMGTAVNEPENFFFYNNGISAVAQNIEENKDFGKLGCKNFSIINGAQTFRSIHKSYSRGIKDSSQIRNLKVMIRITELPDLFKNDGFIDNVTRFNNTQNVVKISDFRSNDKVQNSIANYFDKVSDIDGKKYFYKKKRGKDNPRNTKIIQLDDFCRKIFAFLKGPVDCFGGQKYVYDTSEDGGYFFLFGDKENKEIADSLSQERFNFYSSIFFICETSQNIFNDVKNDRIEREKSLNLDDDKPLISASAFKSKYHLYYLVGVFLNELAKMNNKDISSFLIACNFHKPKVWRKKEYFTDQFLKEIVSVSCDVWFSEYKKSYESGINHRNWLRTSSHLKNLKDEIILSRFSNLESLNISLNNLIIHNR